MTAIVVGKDLRHCARVLYKKLFKPGAFKIIRDAATHEWRTFRPNDAADAQRVHEAKDAPPLIPRRLYDYKKISWEDKKEEVPKCVPLKNGNAIHFFSSLGEPPQGWDVHLVLFDEEIEHPLWYPEMSARLLDNRQEDPKTGKIRNGKFIWSATPQAGTQILYDLCSRAEDQRVSLDGDPQFRPTTEEYVLGLLGNVFMSEGAKQDFIAKIATNEDEYRVRVLGDFALLGSRIYGEFAPHGPHGVEPFVIPEEWTRYCFIDPGRQICAVLFVAVPPPRSEFAGTRYIYDELYIRRCSAAIFAEHMRQKLVSQWIEDWWIDHRAGRMTEIGSGLTPEQQYSEALKKLNVRSIRSGYQFRWASDDVAGGIEAVRAQLHIRDGRPGIVVLRSKTPNLLNEIAKYSYKRTPRGVVTDEPVKLNDHLMDNLRYQAMADLRWVPQKAKPKDKGANYETLKRKREKNRGNKDWGDCIKLG